MVASQQERSQIKNRAIAWAMLKSRLYELELKKREDKANAEAAAKTDIGWGHQIRSYVLQPYQLVKDLRTGAQSTDPQKVLDGDIDAFIEAALAQRVVGRRRGAGRGHRLGGQGRAAYGSDDRRHGARVGRDLDVGETGKHGHSSIRAHGLHGRCEHLGQKQLVVFAHDDRDRGGALRRSAA